jgi:hypothetical protein
VTSVSTCVVDERRAGPPADAVVTDGATLQAHRNDMAMSCASGGPAVLVRSSTRTASSTRARCWHEPRASGRLPPTGARP